MAYTALSTNQVEENKRDLAGGLTPRHQGALTAAVAGSANSGDADPTDLIIEANRTRIAEVEAILKEIGWLST